MISFTNVVQLAIRRCRTRVTGYFAIDVYVRKSLFWVIGYPWKSNGRKPIRTVAFSGNCCGNTEAFEAGKEVPNIITMPFWDMYVSMGGSGVRSVLLIAVLLVGNGKI